MWTRSQLLRMLVPFKNDCSKFESRETEPRVLKRKRCNEMRFSFMQSSNPCMWIVNSPGFYVEYYEQHIVIEYICSRNARMHRELCCTHECVMQKKRNVWRKGQNEELTNKKNNNKWKIWEQYVSYEIRKMRITCNALTQTQTHKHMHMLTLWCPHTVFLGNRSKEMRRNKNSRKVYRIDILER